MPDLLADDLYFDLPEDDCHAGPALGSTALKAIHTNSVDCQEERLYAERDVSKAMIFGKAVHAHVLEGKQVYSDRFKVAPVESDYDEFMVTIPHLRDETTRMDLRLKSSPRKPEIVQVYSVTVELVAPSFEVQATPQVG